MLNFAEALEQTAGEYRYLLLGNGFSISLFPKCFTYTSLFEEAGKSGLFDAEGEIAEAFKLLGTTDFEFVMEALKSASKLAPLYGGDQEKMATHAGLLKEILVQAIAGSHPERPNEISEEQYENCRSFLAQFIGADLKKSGKIFSLNYDLLLYWSVLHDIIGYSWDSEGFSARPDQVLKNDDGFRSPEDNYEAEYVAWDQFEASHGQTITFLHGALHIYERGPELAKLCWERSGNKPLMDQIRHSLDQDRYPLFVSEGSSQKKMQRINKSAYLSKALRSFAGCCGTPGGNIFIIGHSLDDNDDHILNRIKSGKAKRMYVSLFGDENSVVNRAIKAKATRLSDQRSDRYPLDVQFIDASTLHIWEH